MNPVTIVTAFFDIKREENGDGRSIEQYKEWMKRTLRLNCNLFIVTEEKFKDFFIENRRHDYNTYIKLIDFKQLHYYKYYDRMKQIIESNEYKSKIAYPNRVECLMPEYNIIQYSKFHCLQMAVEINKFNSSFFFWLDAGASRFFMDVDIDKPFPGEHSIRFMFNNPNRFIIQNRPDITPFKINDNFIWKADNLLYGTLFGGSIQILKIMSELLENTFNEKMLNQNNVNNEQLALSIIWKKFPHFFYLVEALPTHHLFLFKILSK
jgi:hypothetical protein